MIRPVYITLCSVALAVFAPMTEVEARTAASSAVESDAQGPRDELRRAHTLALLEELFHERGQQMLEADARSAAAASFTSPERSPKASSDALRLTIPRLAIENPGANRRVHARRSPRSIQVGLARADHKQLLLEEASSVRDLGTGAASGFDLGRMENPESERDNPRTLLGTSTWSLVTGTFPLGGSGMQIVARPNGHGANIRARGTF